MTLHIKHNASEHAVHAKKIFRHYSYGCMQKISWGIDIKSYYVHLWGQFRVYTIFALSGSIKPFVKNENYSTSRKRGFSRISKNAQKNKKLTECTHSLQYYMLFLFSRHSSNFAHVLRIIFCQISLNSYQSKA